MLWAQCCLQPPNGPVAKAMPSGELPNVTIFSRCKIRRDCDKTWPVGTQKWGLPNGYKAAPAPCTRIVSQPFFLMQSFRHSNACACGIRRRAGKMLCNSSTEGFEPSGMVVGHPMNSWAVDGDALHQVAWMHRRIQKSFSSVSLQRTSAGIP